MITVLRVFFDFFPTMIGRLCSRLLGRNALSALLRNILL